MQLVVDEIIRRLVAAGAAQLRIVRERPVEHRLTAPRRL
jgi:hypothetical protein